MKIKTTIIAGLLALTLANPVSASAASCSVEKQLASKSILDLHAQVVNAETGEVLFSQDADTPIRTASVLKLLTATVALDVLGPDYQVETKVYQDPIDPTKIYLVGAGDVTLSRMPGNITSYYAKAPKLDTLTRLLKNWSKQSGVQIQTVVTDSTLFGEKGDWHSTWSKLGLSQGYMAPVSALSIDAGRLTNSKNRFIAKRTSKPVEQAGALFLASLNKSKLAVGAKLEQGKLPEGAIQIASVKSRPMSEWVENMLKVSDNSLAEALGRLSSLALGLDGSMESLTPTYRQVLGARGLDVSSIDIVDASGLSSWNLVSADLFTDLLAQIKADEIAAEALIDGLPVSGQRGSLHYRFSSGYKKAAIGKVIAKTGYIHTGYSLAGYLTAKDGTELVFSVFNLGSKVTTNNRIALDNLVFGFYKCGANLQQSAI
ncbi:MAG: D-alanyl-D-alanine carboxypeptidase/D-alanyl-D-alanine-endopeptidase [Aquiluna sp.]|nr:D-alanyl-D-alanine carboxypeptidase/D-alanyl-D-alanine-endopeptidase [Aquiluna sp.]MCF8546197.1 D-alanyl-D-alanine carboxypeptidase/D-alanyl-D-alanine-endopeptidase [Aquiluna sp.]